MNRRFHILALLASAALGVTGYALAANVSVTLNEAGPEPSAVSINWGDAVTFSNADSVEHVIAIARTSYTSPAIPPGGTLDYPFTGRAGTYRFVQRGKQNHAGEITVAVQGSVTMKASREIVGFGASVVLSGRSTFPGSPVVVMAREAGAVGPLKPVLTLIAAADGSYSGQIRPQRGGRYQARVAASQIASPFLTFLVRPRITMSVSPRTVTTGKLIAVTGRIVPVSAAGEANLMAYNRDRKRWIRVQTRRLQNGKVLFRAKLEKGSTRLRIEVSRAAANAGFSVAQSRVVRVLSPK